MTNETRIRILQRIESALSQGFYLRKGSQLNVSNSEWQSFSDAYGGVCVLGAIMADGVNEPNDNDMANILDITVHDLLTLERGFEGFRDFDDGANDFYNLGMEIAKTYI
jgi:hypothetical protein